MSEPRVELTPLLDVIFLLLTFFIYSLVLMVRAQILPVTLPRLTTGEAARGGLIVGITIDQQGRLYYNRQQIDPAELRMKLAEAAAMPHPPAVFVAMEESKDASGSAADRGPIFVEVIETARSVGVKNLNIVGRPGESSRPPSAPPAAR